MTCDNLYVRLTNAVYKNLQRKRVLNPSLLHICQIVVHLWTTIHFNYYQFDFLHLSAHCCSIIKHVTFTVRFVAERVFLYMLHSSCLYEVFSRQTNWTVKCLLSTDSVSYQVYIYIVHFIYFFLKAHFILNLAGVTAQFQWDEIYIYSLCLLEFINCNWCICTFFAYILYTNSILICQ